MTGKQNVYSVAVPVSLVAQPSHARPPLELEPTDNPDIETSSPETNGVTSSDLERRKSVGLAEPLRSVSKLAALVTEPLRSVSKLAALVTEPLRGTSKLAPLAYRPACLRAIAAAFCVFWYCTLGHMEVLKVKEWRDEAVHSASNREQPLQVFAEWCHF